MTLLSHRGCVALHFGDCRLNLESRQLFRGFGEVHLSPKAFELLHLLVVERPRALSKTQLLDRVWRDVCVSEASLARVVNELRQVLGDDARRARIIRTVHGYGYAFGVEAWSDDPGLAGGDRSAHPVAWLTWRTREFALWPGAQIIGRDPTAGVRLDSPRVSRQHARLSIAETCVVEDLGSKNGTAVNGIRIDSPATLEPGADLKIGPFTLIFQWADGQSLTETQHSSSPA